VAIRRWPHTPHTAPETPRDARPSVRPSPGLSAPPRLPAPWLSPKRCHSEVPARHRRVLVSSSPGTTVATDSPPEPPADALPPFGGGQSQGGQSNPFGRGNGGNHPAQGCSGARAAPRTQWVPQGRAPSPSWGSEG